MSLPTDVSIAMTLHDNLSQSITSMRNTVTPFRTDLTELQAELNTLNEKKVDLKIDLTRAKNELTDAKKAFRALGDEESETRLRMAEADYSNIQEQYSLVSRQAKQTTRDIVDATDAITSANDRTTRSVNSGGLLAGLSQAGLTAMAGNALSGVFNSMVGSAAGSETGGILSALVSGATSGAAMGTMLGGPTGTLIGGGIGAAAGLVSGATQAFSSKDDAFKSYVQNSYDTVTGDEADSLTNGSSAAAQREQDAIAFNQLLGQGTGDKYLSDLRSMAAKTPLEYSDLTSMSRALATGFGKDPSRMLQLMQGIGDAGSAVGIDASGMTEMAQAMSRMQSSGKANLEYLQIFQDRGVDVIGMLSQGLGKTQGQIYDMISKGKISGVDAVQTIQAAMEKMYGGAMEKQSQTYAGLQSTLQDAQTEMDAAMGKGYNETRKQGLKDQINWLSGDSGTKMQEANEAIGAWKAELDNQKEKYQRDAVNAMMSTDAYQQAKAQGDAAKMGELIMQAKVQGMDQYNASEGAQLALKSETDLAGAIRDDAASNQSYWDAGYKKGQQFSIGLADGMRSKVSAVLNQGGAEAIDGYDANGNTVTYWVNGEKPDGSHAAGLRRVPYNNYLALLHQDERIQTAAEARNNSGNGAIQVTITGNSYYVREESDIDAIISGFTEQIKLARKAGTY